MNVDAPVRLIAEDVLLKPAGQPFAERIAAGEIVGLAGLDGHGQELFIETLAGLRPAEAGRISVRSEKGRDHAVRGFRAAVAHGLAYLPRDRRTTGIFPTLSILDNFAIATIRKDCTGGIISARRRRERYAYWRERLSIVAPDPGQPITTLSGGNQQKVLLARALAQEPKVLLLDDPTRGVDIATRKVLYEAFRQLAAEGMALVILSTEIEEALALCGRIMVFRERQLASRLVGADMNSERIIATMFGRDS